MQSVMNLKIKFRESFRPFAPTVLRECVHEFFELDADSPYMLQVAPVKAERQIPMSEDQQRLFGTDKLNVPRSDMPAVTHVDYSARVQTLRRQDHPRYYDVIRAFSEPDRLSSGGQHVLQRARRTHRPKPGRCLSLLHADGDGFFGYRLLYLRQERPAAVAGRARLARGV